MIPIEGNVIWEELGLFDLLDSIPRTLEENRSQLDGRKNDSVQSKKHRKIINKPGYAVVMQRYESRPHLPKTIRSKKLDKLADPLRGRFSYYDKRKNKPSKDTSSLQHSENSEFSPSRSPPMQRNQLYQVKKILNGTEERSAPPSGFFITEGDTDMIFHANKATDQLAAKREKDFCRYRKLQQPVLSNVSQASKPMKNSKRLKDQKLRGTAPLWNVRSSGYGNQIKNTSPTRKSVARKHTVNIRSGKNDALPELMSAQRKSNRSVMTGTQEHYDALKGLTSADRNGTATEKLELRSNFLRSRSTIDILDPIGESELLPNRKINRTKHRIKQTENKEKGGRKLSGTKSAPGVLTRRKDQTFISRNGLRKLSPLPRSRCKSKSNECIQKSISGSRQVSVHSKTGESKSFPHSTGNGSAKVNDAAQKVDVVKEDVLLSTMERLNKYCNTTNTLRKNSITRKNGATSQLDSSENSAHQDAVLLAQRARSICNNYESARSHLENYKLLADGLHESNPR